MTTHSSDQSTSGPRAVASGPAPEQPAPEAVGTPSETSSATTYRVEVWPDHVVEQLGHDPRSAYVETFWLSVLGPSTTWLLRRLVMQLDDEPDGFEVRAAELSTELGLGGRTGRNSVFTRSIDRAIKFGAIQRNGQSLYVRRRLAPLAARHVQRLPRRLQLLHEAWGPPPGTTRPQPAPADGSAPISADDQRLRARRLALTLFELGENAASTERQLHRWHFHPSLAFDATRWALERHRAARLAASPEGSEGAA